MVNSLEGAGVKKACPLGAYIQADEDDNEKSDRTRAVSSGSTTGRGRDLSGIDIRGGCGRCGQRGG